VTVPDGSTIILGGMVKLNQNKGGSKVPILGDIPLVGGLFRSIATRTIQSKLYVFVKAEIIRPDGPSGHGMKELGNPPSGTGWRSRNTNGVPEASGLARHQAERVDPPKVLDAH
jgi:type II secretory pathway component GspD/PulD (secretin)